MAYPQLVYNVAGIFGACLDDYEAHIYKIAAYQRGYKWDTEVNKLVRDLREACEMAQKGSGHRDYYLQYITIKRQAGPIGKPAYLDVIDGQQRLTTLSLLFALLRHLLPDQPNFTEQRLDYAVRQNFLKEFVYAGQIARLLEPAKDEATAWREFIGYNPDYDCQDVWYLFKAARTMRDFLVRAQADGLALVDFSAYVAGHVMLIVNLIEARVSSEKVFRNLNSTKVELTETELLKGLLLTRVGREPATGQAQARSPQQIVELRHAMGRQWDEMTRWLNRPAVVGFFEPAGLTSVGTERLFPLLHLVATQAGYPGEARTTSTQRFAVFEYVQQSIRQGQRTATYYFERLRLLFSLLHDWYERPELHNLLGFLFFSKQLSSARKVQLLRTLTDEAWLLARQQEEISVTVHLKKMVSKLPCLHLIPATMRYGGDDEAIQDLLLLLDVFPKQFTKGSMSKFDFARFGTGAWSLEHIFPQHPELSQLRNLEKADQQLVLELVEPVQQQQIGPLLLQSQPLNDQQQQTLEEQFQLDLALLHGLGNMTLLERGHNSTLKNVFFDEKRRRIVSLISAGGFVPPHTFNVFSRLLPATGSSSAVVWAKADMQAHLVYLAGEQARLLTHFQAPSA
jgi:hypothetical protein